MKIILLKDIKKQGKKGEIIEVKEGYGNFLIKNKEAVLATTTGVNRLNVNSYKGRIKLMIVHLIIYITSDDLTAVLWQSNGLGRGFSRNFYKKLRKGHCCFKDYSYLCSPKCMVLNLIK